MRYPDRTPHRTRRRATALVGSAAVAASLLVSAGVTPASAASTVHV